MLAAMAVRGGTACALRAAQTPAPCGRLDGMRAVTCTGPGGPEVLTISDVDTPEPAAGEVRIAVAAAGVNRADLLQRQGHYPPPKGISDIIGLEVSGRVDAVGDGVDTWKAGDEVVALLAGGGYAEYAVAPAGQCAPLPPGVDLVSAGGIIEVAATVTSNLRHIHLAAGETFLVHGGAGGIGSFAIPFAKSLGATVLTTAGSQDKLDYCRRLGADAAFDYHEDWAGQAREFTGGRGVDTILDIMGAKYLEAHVALLARGGRMVVIGMQGGRKGTLDLSVLLAKGATITATSLRFRPVEQKEEIVADVVATVWPQLANHPSPLPPETRFPLDEVADAHRHLASGDNTGKIVLTL